MIKTHHLRATLTLIVSLTAAPLFAATFTVNSPVDVNDANPGDGICETAPGNGVCTLRAAIHEANALMGSDIINLPALPAPNAYVLTIAAELTISGDLTINGGGAATTIIDGNRNLRPDAGVLRMPTPVTVTVSALTVRNGGRSASVFAGGIDGGNLALINSTVSGNSTINDSGGIRITGTVSLTNSTVSGNSTSGSGGGILNFGSLTLTNSTVSGNTATQGGGGIVNVSGTINLVSSTVSGNTTAKDGGGIINSGGGTINLVNSTVSGNGVGLRGGGIRSVSGTIRLFNATIANNLGNLGETMSAGTAGAGLFLDGGTLLSFQNTIILGNLDSAGFLGQFPSDCIGTVTSNGNNVMGSPTLAGCTVNGGGVTFVDGLAGPYLGALQNNGGPTQTHALLANNPALNGGNVLGCRDQFGGLLTTDQRGFPRPSPGTNCDAGAFESQATEVPAIVCPAMSLQSAIDNAVPGQVIRVAGLCSESLIVRNEKQRITIDGAGAGSGTRATITSSVTIRGKGILLQNFNINTFSGDGVHVNRGSNAVIHNNVIQNTGFVTTGAGVVVDQLSFAVLTANTVLGFGEAGVLVSNHATARIGFNSDGDTVASANTIQSNAVGIRVTNGSSARIVGNTVQSNSGDGIRVTRDSHADIAGNLINGNADGIEVGENSTVQLGEDSGTSIFEAANSTTVNNGGVALRCTTGGVADGKLGSLFGSGGPKSFAPGCIDSLVP